LPYSIRWRGRTTEAVAVLVWVNLGLVFLGKPTTAKKALPVIGVIPAKEK
jgi:hypothetical protein